MTKDEALRLAWDALEDIGDEWGFTSQRTVPKRKEAITAIKEALAQPNFCPICGKRLGTNDWDIHTCTPPQRTWVGLTDEELDALYRAVKVRLMGTYSTKDIYRAVEAKLKEKNT
jgi:hypothetical protein